MLDLQEFKKEGWADIVHDNFEKLSKQFSKKDKYFGKESFVLENGTTINGKDGAAALQCVPIYDDIYLCQLRISVDINNINTYDWREIMTLPITDNYGMESNLSPVYINKDGHVARLGAAYVNRDKVWFGLTVPINGETAATGGRVFAILYFFSKM